MAVYWLTTKRVALGVFLISVPLVVFGSWGKYKTILNRKVSLRDVTLWYQTIPS